MVWWELSSAVLFSYCLWKQAIKEVICEAQISPKTHNVNVQYSACHVTPGNLTPGKVNATFILGHMVPSSRSQLGNITEVVQSTFSLRGSLNI